MMMPNFLVIGAAKAGTTALYEYLRQHPQIYMSPHKEPRFFAIADEPLDFQGPGDLTRFKFVRDLKSYQALFKGVSGEIAIGEASPWYLYVPKAVKRIQHHIPDAKLIVILRDPVERAYSNFIHAVREDLEPLNDFAQAMEAEAERIRNNWSYRWHYKQKGLYYNQLKRYLDHFHPAQIKVLLYEDFQKDTLAALQEIFHFLDVDDTFIPDTKQKHNVSGIPKNKDLDKLITGHGQFKSTLKSMIPFASLRQHLKRKFLSLNMNQKPDLNSTVRQHYIEFYRPDILQLQALIQRDLSSWLKV